MRAFAFLFFFSFFFNCNAQTFQDGDVIFQHSRSAQSSAIQLATNSYFSHCGIIFFLGNNPYVYEAIEPVGVRSLEDWISSGENGEYALYRLKGEPLSEEQLSKMKNYLRLQLDKHYDLVFNWSDKEMYCSELVYKTYNSVGIKLCEPKALKEFNLESPQVRKIMQMRYGGDIPYDEPMISPGQLSDSELFFKVF